MFYVYILKDLDNKIYIGYTNNIERRLVEHKAGTTQTTSRMNQPELYYYEAYTLEIYAKEREQKLKQFGSSYTGLIKRIGLR